MKNIKIYYFVKHCIERRPASKIYLYIYVWFTSNRFSFAALSLSLFCLKSVSSTGRLGPKFDRRNIPSTGLFVTLTKLNCAVQYVALIVGGKMLPKIRSLTKWNSHIHIYFCIYLLAKSYEWLWDAMRCCEWLWLCMSDLYDECVSWTCRITSINGVGQRDRKMPKGENVKNLSTIVTNIIVSFLRLIQNTRGLYN